MKLKKYHYEKIVCPECNYIQKACVLHTNPFFTYIKRCKCGYVIMESDWDIVNNKKKLKGVLK